MRLGWLLRAWPPGCWVHDVSHFPRPVTRFWAEVFPRHFGAGYRVGARRCALLVDRFEWRPVRRYLYAAPVPIGAPRLAAAGRPPAIALRLYGRVHPELRRRLVASETVLERKPWRDDLAFWDREAKPAAIRRQRELIATRLEDLDTGGLIDHLDGCEENLRRMLEIHGELTLSSTLAVGDFAARASELVDLPEERLLGLLRGATPLSVASDELRLLLERLREDPGAAAVLEEGDPTTAIDRLGEWDDAVGEAARAYLDLAGQQLVGGYDIAERRGVEVPEQIVAGLRAALARGDARQGPAGSVFEEVRAAIPDRHRQEVDDLVTEARLGYRLREERSLYGQSWAGGIMRRAVLEAGSRLARARRVHDAEHAVETSSRELRRLLSGRRGPSADELRLRFEERLDAGVAAPPATLGPRSAGAPVDRLPPGARRAAAAGDASYRAIFDPDDVEPRDPERVTGRGVSTGLYEGRARLIAGPADFGRLERGDVLVTVSTSASFNVVLPLLGAVVTDRGGALSHAAIVAREYGIPGVVGCRDATHRLTDGARVRVSGDEGYVEQLDAP